MCQNEQITKMKTIKFRKPRPGFNVDLWDLGQRKKTKRSGKIIRFSFGRSVLMGMTLILCSLSSATAKAEINPNQAILAIVGEAEDQGLTGMTAVAEAIRNRGHLRGVYGLKSPRLKKAPQWVFAMARKAWEESQQSNLVKGATHWENIKAFGVPYWAPSMKQTAIIKDHAFYRAVKP